MTEPKSRPAIAGLAFALLLLPVAANATDFKCGKDYVTFQTTGTKKNGASRIVTTQKRLVLFVVKTSDGITAVQLGRDGVPNTGTNFITTDTYHRFITCLD